VKIEADAYSSKGPKRPLNEDSFLLAGKTGGIGITDTSETFTGTIADAQLFFVADGMGGHSAGDVASAFVVEKLRETVNPMQDIDCAYIEEIIKSIHTQLLADGINRGTPNMGSTLAGLILQKGSSGFCNVGDSRVYRLRNSILQQLSRDDSLASIIPGAAKNIITNAVGAGLADISVDSRFSPYIAVEGDTFLICSDGVHGFIADTDLEQLLALQENPQKIAQLIVEKAIENNSDDNCTAVVVRIMRSEDSDV
jgi:protein phosphatase